MNITNKRYIFTDFESIQKVKFKTLERVSDKIFILINASDDFIPFELVKNLQKLGKAVKWIPVENNKNLTLNYHICYLIGKMHTKINDSIEFAILSDDDAFDSMINYINSNNRVCTRVKTDVPNKKIVRKAISSAINITNNRINLVGDTVGDSTEEATRIVYFDEPHEATTAYQVTKDRLRLVTTRPYNLSSLRDYIHINNQELVERGKLSVENVIEMMEQNNEIEIKAGIVAYHF